MYSSSLVFVFGLPGISICICIHLIKKYVQEIVSRLCILAPWYLYSGSHPARDNQCWHCVSKLCPCCCLGQQSSKKRRPNLGIGPDQRWPFFHPSENHVCPGQSCICCLALYFHNFYSFSLPLSSFYVAAENNEGHCALGPAFRLPSCRLPSWLSCFRS